jgi:acetyl esterase/lipase
MAATRFRRISSLLIPVLALLSLGSCSLPQRDTAKLTWLPQPSSVSDLAYGSDPAQQLTLYSPADDSAAARPVLVFLHSGSWVGGSRNEIPLSLQNLAGRGYVVASVDYRLSSMGTNRIGDALNDLRTMLHWLVTQRDALHLDTHRVILSGASAGGTLAARIGAELDEPERAIADLTVTQVVDWAGPLSTKDIWATDSIAAAFLAQGFGCMTRNNCAYDDRLDPLPHFGPTDPPLTVVQGELDPILPTYFTTGAVSRIRAAGGLTDYIQVPGQMHDLALCSESYWAAPPADDDAVDDSARSGTVAP